jgi:hypothetical protein
MRREEKGIVVRYIKVVEKRRTDIDRGYILFISTD